MKSRITGKPAETPNKKSQKETELKDDELTLEDLIEMGLIDEETDIRCYPKSVRNVINHDD